MESNDKSTIDELCTAIQDGNIPLIQHLCRYTVDLSQVNRDGKTVLQVAISNGRADIALWFLANHGSNISVDNKDTYGDTALFSAVYNQLSPDLIKQLALRSTIPFNEKVFGHKTLLDCAIEKSSSEVIKVLLERGALVNLHHSTSKTKGPLREALNRIKEAHNEQSLKTACDIHHLVFTHGISEDQYRKYATGRPDNVTAMLKRTGKELTKAIEQSKRQIAKNKPKQTTPSRYQQPLPVTLHPEDPRRHFRTFTLTGRPVLDPRIVALGLLQAGYPVQSLRHSHS